MVCAARGFVLPIVLIVIALLSVLSMGLSQMARQQMRDLQFRKDLWGEQLVATNILHYAVYGLLVGDYRPGELAYDGRLVPIDGQAIELFGRRVALQDGAGLFSLALYNRQKFSQLLESLTDKRTAFRISTELADWTDEDDTQQFQGLEALNYLSNGLIQSPRNQPIRAIGELLELPSMTPELLNGNSTRVGLQDLVLAGGVDHFNVATAPDQVLGSMMDLSKGKAASIIAAKKRKDWDEVLRLVDATHWIFNDYPPLAQGNRYLLTIDGENKIKTKAQILLTPYQANKPFALIDWHAPYYNGE